MERIKDSEDVGIRLLCKLDQKLFLRSTRGASEVLAHKGGEFADDVVPLLTMLYCWLPQDKLLRLLSEHM